VSTYETIEFSVDGHVGWLRLNRPDKLNSFTIKMWQEMRALGKELRDDPNLRALVVVGNGRAFSSGIDTSVFTGGGAEDGITGGEDVGTRHADPQVDGILRTQEAYSWLEEARYPTIAAVRGFALGAGLQLALACDIRMFAHGTSVGLLEHKYGILPDLGGTQRLPRIVGAGRAKEMIWTAARIDADEAYRIGLCEQLVSDEELDESAEKLAERIAGQPPLAIAAAKRAVNASLDERSVDGLRVEAEGQATCLPSEDMKEAIAAFVEQRPPIYENH
jgi:enoyl-CoA hydratase/carnithine racemase